MRTAGLVLVLALLSGCSGSDDTSSYDEADYRAGDCRTAAPDVFAIRLVVEQVVADDEEPSSVVGGLQTLQQRLIGTSARISDQATKDSAQKVIDAVGFYRIGIDAKNFTPKLASDVHDSAQRFLDTCSVK